MYVYIYIRTYISVCIFEYFYMYTYVIQMKTPKNMHLPFKKVMLYFFTSCSLVFDMVFDQVEAELLH